MLRPVSMDSATARFHISTCHQDWSETIYKITPTMEHFTLLFPRLSKVFNYCKMIGSHVRWWNDLALGGDFILFHRVENKARGVSTWWNYFLLSPLRFMQKVKFSTHDTLINMHDILVKPPLRLALVGLFIRLVGRALHFISVFLEMKFTKLLEMLANNKIWERNFEKHLGCSYFVKFGLM